MYFFSTINTHTFKIVLCKILTKFLIASGLIKKTVKLSQVFYSFFMQNIPIIHHNYSLVINSIILLKVV